MSLTGTILLVAVLGPFVALMVLRILRTRLTALPFYSIGTLLFASVAAAVIWLVQQPVEHVSVGNLTLVQPQGIDLLVEPEFAVPVPEAEPTLAPVITRTPRPTPTATRTPRPTVTRVPTRTPTRTPLTVTEPEPQRYVVQSGDTLRSIADTFDVSVADIIQANDLTPEASR